MTNSISPWLGMRNLSQRRVDASIHHDIFWITDVNGKYGFQISTDICSEINCEEVSLRGIQLIIDNTRYINQIDFFLILQNNVDWEIFRALCDDLIKVVRDNPEGKEMISAVELRLRRWQQLLKQDNRSPFSLQQQMGLFSELLCLKNIVLPKLGIHQAITSWNGPELDKQDFLLDDAALEVKSYRTSKGDTINISSLKQLDSEKSSMYLAAYALTPSENGISIYDLAEEIRLIIREISTLSQLEELFESKLIAYGYVPELINDELHSFIVDNQRLFTVTDTFPRITPKDVRDPIASVSYSIDLSKCLDYETNLEDFNSEG